MRGSNASFDEVAIWDVSALQQAIASALSTKAPQKVSPASRASQQAPTMAASRRPVRLAVQPSHVQRAEAHAERDIPHWPVVLCGMVALIMAVAAFIESPLAKHPTVRRYTAVVEQGLQRGRLELRTIGTRAQSTITQAPRR